MAWYALYKWFIPWRKTPYINMISMYKRYLYDEWFNSLSEEDQIKVKEIEKRSEEKRKRDLFSSLYMMKHFIELYGKFTN